MNAAERRSESIGRRMGIYDRDYARIDREPSAYSDGRSALSRMRWWSATTWLIVINVAVFVVDNLAGARYMINVPASPAFVQTYEPATRKWHVDESHLIPSRSSPGLMAHPILDNQSGELVGELPLRAMQPLTAIGHFSTSKGFFGLEVWRLVSFQFLHANVTHLFLNMLGLWMFGQQVERHLGQRSRYVAFYLMCGICGAILYQILNIMGALGVPLPGALDVSITTPLVGASAGVFAILMASAYFAGEETMLVFGIIPLKVRTGAYLFASLALFNLLIGGSNAGGDAAHVGGAIAGYFFIRHPHLLKDFFAEFSARRPGNTSSQPRRPRRRAKIDRILDKVSEHGLDSLTKREQRYLNRTSEGKR